MLDTQEIQKLESGLNCFDPELREISLTKLRTFAEAKNIIAAAKLTPYNLHCHTFCSYNGYGYSPTYIAWLACKKLWFAAGIVDFDVLDGAGEFLAAAERLEVRGVCGLETRTYVAELASSEINSPGEPGVAYHMGVGFTTAELPPEQRQFLAGLKAQAVARTENIIRLVNAYLSPVKLDFTADAVSLTPFGNVTERHACAAYRRKAEEIFPDTVARAGFWAEKLALSLAAAADLLRDPVRLEGTIRAKTMKKGGPGYVQASPESFPALAEMNAFTLACGALPCVAWLDGMSAGEQNPEALLDLHLAHGAALLNIIPDRNWNFSDPAVRAAKTKCLDAIIAAARKRSLPVIVGTEMNAPGQKLIDDFDCEALEKHTEIFTEGAAVAFAHMLLTPLQMGYLSEWAAANFSTKTAKNAFFAEFGRALTPRKFSLVKERLNGKTATRIREELHF
ncbi:MAG: hypothetical protein PHH77_05595 [Victivallaceae bacterium]|nr:hypothetical protein [Victivallaceae bacterium]